MKPIERDQSLQNRNQELKQGFSKKDKAQVLPQPVVAPDNHRKSAESKAESIGVNRGAIDRASFIKSNNPELAELVAQGETKATQAIRAIKTAQVVSNLEEIAAKEIESPTGLYDVIVIDPPWPIQKIDRDKVPMVAFLIPKRRKRSLDLRRCERRYPTHKRRSNTISDVRLF